MSFPSLEVFKRAEVWVPLREDDKGALHQGEKVNWKLQDFHQGIHFIGDYFPQVRSQVELSNCSISYFAILVIIIIIINHKILKQIMINRKRRKVTVVTIIAFLGAGLCERRMNIFGKALAW